MLGILIYNGNRPDIALENGTLYGGLHCGDCFRCCQDGWIDVRLEWEEEEWVLICQGKHLPLRYGTQVSI